MTAAASKRRVVLHVDDVGMCHGANSAYVELSRFGTCSSGSVMVPCPWFLEAAENAAADPSLDLGVHLTLNSEKQYYKWRPLTSPSPAAGLTDDLGHFFSDVTTTRRKAAPEAVEAELRAQIEVAVRTGFDITHFDAHMGAAMAPEFCDIYLRLGQEYRLPVLITSTIAAYTPNDNLPGVGEHLHQPSVDAAQRMGFAVFDEALQTTWQRPKSQPAEPAYKALIESIGDGLTFVCLHVNAPGELEAIEPKSSYIRTQEYDVLRDPAFRDWLLAQDLDIIGMRPLRDELRAGVAAAN